MYRIKNIKTEQVYPVTESGWQDIVRKGWASKYEIVETLRPAADRASKIPNAIAQAVIDEAGRDQGNEQPNKATKAIK